LIDSDKRHIYVIAFFYALLMIIIIGIPAYFYIGVEKENYRQIRTKELERYAFGVQKSIYDFSRTERKVYDFPRSLEYDAILFDRNGRMRFSTDGLVHTTQMFDTPDTCRIVKRIALAPNRLGAAQLVVSEPISYRDIYNKVMISALFIGMVIFISTFFFIRMSLYPLERANRRLNTFFNDAMHELKTPLGVITLNLEFLAEKYRGKELTRLQNSVRNISMIYEDIEYLIKHRYIDYRPERIDVSALLIERVELFRDLANVKSITLQTQIDPSQFVNINRIELQRIIDNTLSNAVKYSGEKTEISVRLVRERTHIVISITDHGHGINEVNRIFERYHREDTVKGGFGIGLSIVKHICDKNDIGLYVESEPGEGSTFSYTFTVDE
jgi:two-component system, OmpR family, sensor kinase